MKALNKIQNNLTSYFEGQAVLQEVKKALGDKVPQYLFKRAEEALLKSSLKGINTPLDFKSAVRPIRGYISSKKRQAEELDAYEAQQSASQSWKAQLREAFGA